MKTLAERQCRHCKCSMANKRPNALICGDKVCRTEDRKVRNKTTNDKRPTINPKTEPKSKHKTKDEPNEPTFMEFLNSYDRNQVITRRHSYKYQDMTEEEIQASYLEDLY